MCGPMLGYHLKHPSLGVGLFHWILSNLASQSSQKMTPLFEVSVAKRVS